MATTTYPIYPAANVFPMLPEDELAALAEDIKEHGLRDQIVLWRGGLGGALCLLDGRNRQAALERLGWPVEEYTTVLTLEELPDPAAAAAYVISRNIRRRHLTKQQQAELIVRVIESTKEPATESAKVAASVPRNANGHLQGSTKDPVVVAAVEEGAKHDISKRTVERALATVRAETGPPRKVHLVPAGTRTINMKAPFTQLTAAAPAPGQSQEDVRAELRHLLAEGRRRMKSLKRAPVGRLHTEFITWMLTELARIAG